MSTHRLDAWADGRRMGTLAYHDDTGRFAFDRCLFLAATCLSKDHQSGYGGAAKLPYTSRR